MKISNDRSELDDVLENPRTLILFLFGGAKALEIYEQALKVVREGWRRPVYFENASQLTPKELALWQQGTEGYAVLKRDRTLGGKGGLGDLCDETGVPDGMKIRQAFSRAE